MSLEWQLFANTDGKVVTMIPHDEAHRFLNWQTGQAKCGGWVAHLTELGVPYELARHPTKGWTIYKHCYTEVRLKDAGTRRPGQWCCGATA